MSLTDLSTAAGAKTRSSHPSRKITGLALSIACRAPSENFPSEKKSERDRKLNVEVADDEVDRGLSRHPSADSLIRRLSERERERRADRL